MVLFRTFYLAVGVVATAAANMPQGLPTSLYTLQGGASGLETEGDYVENKIARKIHAVFGSAAQTAADEAKYLNSAAKDAAHKAANQARGSAQNVRDAARSTAKSAGDAAKSARESAHIPREQNMMPKLSWVGGGKTVPAADERNAVTKFMGNPNNVFIAQGVVALLFGGLHLVKYDSFAGKLAGPLRKLLGPDWAAGLVGPHIKLVGAYSVGVLVSDVLAYKSNSAGFKRGKIWHEMGTNIAIAAVCLTELFLNDSTDMLPHAIAALLFTGWYSYLAQQY